MLNFEDTLILKNAIEYWDKLTSTQQELLINHSTVQHYKKGTVVHDATNECLGVLFIKSGELRTYIVSDEGKEITLYRIFPNEVCILSASCVLQNISFDVMIDAQQDTEFILVNSSTFSSICQQNIYLENFSLKETVNRFSDVMWAIEQILFMSFDQRLANFLVQESLQNETLTLEITHEQIARYIGSAREVVTRMLKYFQEEGIVELTRGKIVILNKEKLKKHM